MRLHRTLALLLLVAFAAPTLGHDYFVGQVDRDHQIPATGRFEVAIGRTVQFIVRDREGCSADITSSMDLPSIATVTPNAAEGEKVVFEVTGVAVGLAKMTIHVKGKGLSDGHRPRPCTEDLEHPFSICVVPDVSEKEVIDTFRKVAKDARDSLKAKLKSYRAGLAAANKAILADLDSAAIPPADAERRLVETAADAKRKIDDAWTLGLEEARAAGRQTLDDLGFPECSLTLRQLARGVGGLWDTLVKDFEAAADAEKANVNKQLAKPELAVAKAAEAAGTGLATVMGHGQQVPPIGSPADKTPPATQAKFVIIGSQTASRSKGLDDGVIDVVGYAAANSQVEVRITGPDGYDETVSVTADAQCKWKFTVYALQQGGYTITARYPGDKAVAADYISVP